MVICKTIKNLNETPFKPFPIQRVCLKNSKNASYKYCQTWQSQLNVICSIAQITSLHGRPLFPQNRTFICVYQIYSFNEKHLSKPFRKQERRNQSVTNFAICKNESFTWITFMSLSHLNYFYEVHITFLFVIVFCIQARRK